MDRPSEPVVTELALLPVCVGKISEGYRPWITAETTNAFSQLSTCSKIRICRWMSFPNASGSAMQQ